MSLSSGRCTYSCHCCCCCFCCSCSTARQRGLSTVLLPSVCALSARDNEILGMLSKLTLCENLLKHLNEVWKCERISFSPSSPFACLPIVISLVCCVCLHRVESRLLCATINKPASHMVLSHFCDALKCSLILN